jgi:DNA-binding NarL/FixJ family response regulator
VTRARVLIAHSVSLLSAGIEALLARSGEFEVVNARTENDGETLIGSRRFADVVIADFTTALRAMSSAGGCRNVLIISQDDGEARVRMALEHGVRGYLLYSCSADELTAAIRAVSYGGTALAASVAVRVAQSFVSEQLTEREMQILRLMMHGLSNKDIARKLVIALGTVKSHVKSILTKLGAARRTEAAAIAQRRGIAPLEWTSGISIAANASSGRYAAS